MGRLGSTARLGSTVRLGQTAARLGSALTCPALVRAIADTLKAIAELPNVDVWYTLDQPPDNWSYSSGFIDEAMVRNHLPAPGPKTYIFCCGPPPMIDFACKPNLEKVGHAASNVRCF